MIMHVPLYCITISFILFRTLDPHRVPVYKTIVLSTCMGLGHVYHAWICRPVYAQNIHKTRMFNVAMFTVTCTTWWGDARQDRLCCRVQAALYTNLYYSVCVSDSVEICRRSTNSVGNTSADGRADQIVLFFSLFKRSTTTTSNVSDSSLSSSFWSAAEVTKRNCFY